MSTCIHAQLCLHIVPYDEKVILNKNKSNKIHVTSEPSPNAGNKL